MVPSSDRNASQLTQAWDNRNEGLPDTLEVLVDMHTIRRNKQRTMKGLMQQRIVPSLLVWLWVGAQTVLSLSSNNKPTRRDFVNTAIIGTAGLL